MGSSNKGNKKLNEITSIITAVGTIVTIAAPLIEKAIDNVGGQTNSENKVKVPELYCKGFPIDLEQAIQILDDCGLKSSISKLTVKEANPKFKDYFDTQVIDSNPKQGKVVKIGSTICLRYISEDVIIESQRISDEMERSKINTEEKRAIKKIEHKNKIKKMVTGAADKTKCGASKIFSNKRK